MGAGRMNPNGAFVWRALWSAGLWDGLEEKLAEAEPKHWASGVKDRLRMGVPGSENAPQEMVGWLRWATLSGLESALEEDAGYYPTRCKVSEGMACSSAGKVLSMMAEGGLEWCRPSPAFVLGEQSRLVAKALAKPGLARLFLASAAEAVPIVGVSAVAGALADAGPEALGFEFAGKKAMVSESLGVIAARMSGSDSGPILERSLDFFGESGIDWKAALASFETQLGLSDGNRSRGAKAAQMLKAMAERADLDAAMEPGRPRGDLRL